MPKQLQKTLQDCLSKIKKHPIPHLSFSTSWILKSCNQPKTPSFFFDDKETEQSHHDHDATKLSATLSDIETFLQENFKSLYLKNDDDEDEDDEEKSGGFFFDSPRFIDPPPDLCCNNRFFVASSCSRSLVEGTQTSTTMSEPMQLSSFTTPSIPQNDAKCVGDNVDGVTDFDDFIAVFTSSASPCNDFRRSMQEMIEARLKDDGKVDWEFMEELLFCYFNLNHSKSYKYIISAFVDMVIVLRENSWKLPVRASHRESTGERRKKRGDAR